MRTDKKRESEQKIPFAKKYHEKGSFLNLPSNTLLPNRKAKRQIRKTKTADT
jgi:hypothetical protein